MKHIILNTTNAYTCLKKGMKVLKLKKKIVPPCMRICDESVMKRLIRKNPGVLLGILGGGVPPGSPNPRNVILSCPDPISDQKISFFTPVFRPGL